MVSSDLLARQFSSDLPANQIGDLTSRELDVAAAKREYDDLREQNRMAHAAEAMICVAIAQTIIAAIGMFAIWRSLKHARETAQATVDANTDTVALHRPWIYPIFSGSGGLPTDAFFGFSNPGIEFRLANYGSSSALVEELSHAVVLKPSGIVPVKADCNLTSEPSLPSRLLEAGKQGEVMSSIYEGSVKHIDWDEYATAKGSRFYLILEIRYRDVFDGVTTERFCMKLLSKGAMWERRGDTDVNFREYKRRRVEPTKGQSWWGTLWSKET